MARPLPRILTRADPGAARLARSRELARSAADGASDVLHPLITVGRGLGRLAGAARRGWSGTPRDRRGPLVFLVAAVALVVALVPYGPLTAGIALMGAAAWLGRGPRRAVREGPDEAESQRLRSLYEALVPHFSSPDDPEPRYVHGGAWDRVFEGGEFDGDGGLERLTVRYAAYFDDGDARARARVEQLVAAKAGRGREYHFEWRAEANELLVEALPPLPAGIVAQRFVTAPGEIVLGFTDAVAVRRTLPVTVDGAPRDVPPVLWRTGPRSVEPHLLAVGQPGSGTTSLLRSVALQALRQGEVVVVEGGGSGEFACLRGRPGVRAVECGLTGALAALEWVARETERRLLAAGAARQAGQEPPGDTARPLWLLLDRPGVLAHLAAAEGRQDPRELLDVPLRHGRGAGVTVVVAEQFDGLDGLGETVFHRTRARVVLGSAPPELVADVLGTAPRAAADDPVPPGRGHARFGTGPVHRLQVPATPDPYDTTAAPDEREAVLALLPGGESGQPGEPEEPEADAALENGTTPDDATPPTAPRRAVPVIAEG
ncbi:hypothetical protein [Streptomyces sp. NPDC050560]|uniref:hypothetical protein n=1 Tax=Streptomyces sp. NPDC050560 TaxID=3365630 RepID=UPI0037A214EA